MPPVQLKQVEGTMHRASEWWWRISSKSASPFSSQTIASPSIRHDRTGSFAVAIKGQGHTVRGTGRGLRTPFAHDVEHKLPATSHPPQTFALNETCGHARRYHSLEHMT
jgi:hypothetical protein